ncbi:Arc family DNA-binding protein [Dokdonella ginsengisoli]|uniref:Arc family DNA-binding protein n=1 Tax=Dokdonella ginsengisoli TaxID=363846 RepID=A0ABV9QWB4_9GAMM
MNDDGYTRITLRMPNDLHAKLTAEAARTSRSMNAEIVGRLTASFERPAVKDAARDNAAALQRILDRLDAQRQEVEGAKLKMFSMVFERRMHELLAEGLSREEAFYLAEMAAREIAFPG